MYRLVFNHNLLPHTKCLYSLSLELELCMVGDLYQHFSFFVTGMNYDVLICLILGRFH